MQMLLNRLIPWKIEKTIEFEMHKGKICALLAWKTFNFLQLTEQQIYERNRLAHLHIFVIYFLAY